MLALLGYRVLAVDMYGNGLEAETSKEAAKYAQELSENPEIRKSRFMAALEFLKSQKNVDPEHIAAIVYSLGGNVWLNMAIESVDIDGVVSIYG